MTITFFGAAQGVTGSKHLIESNGFRLLLDCGLHQGRRSEARELNKKLPFDAHSIDAVILSHAHADHCGMLPVLVKQGFRGKIYTTNATTDLAEYIMLDSAKIQEQDSIYLNDKMPPGQDPVPPLYTEEDVLNVMPYFERVPYFRIAPHWTKINENIRFKLYDAGHILGSCMPVVEITENGAKKTIGFTGDIGKPGAPLLHNPELITEQLDALLMECTYGDRDHRPIDEAEKDLVRIIKQAYAKKSKIIVPAFALGRTQELIYTLHKLTDAGEIPRIPIYIDSPLALNITDVMAKHSEDYDEETASAFSKDGEAPFTFRNLNYVHSKEDSKALNSKKGPFMIISASGMCEGGRILHHLKNNIEDHSAVIMLTGYQAQNTLGRKLHHGVSPVNIFGRPYKVNAEIVTFNEFSAHADRSSLLKYLQSIPTPKKVCLVHTEDSQYQSFQELLKQKMPGLDVHIPAPGESIEI